MIPRKIQIKNFLSYGPEIQTIDFSTYNLICLSGKNGHGKSALLDAITWALWGQARKVSESSKPDENLVRLGQTHMLVILDFEFNQRHYRVRREFVKTYGKPIAVLDFGIVSQDDQTMQPLTEKTIRATQAKIESLLNLDAESFTNSAFLRQGHSNEFSKKSAKERKEILANILGISRYEAVRKAALEKIKQAQSHQISLTTIIEGLQKELEHKGILIQQHEALATTLKNHALQEQQAAQVHQVVIKESNDLQQLKQQHALASAQQTALNTRFEQELNALFQVRHQWRLIEQKLRTSDNNRDLEEEKRANAKLIMQHQTALQTTLEIKEQILATKELLQATQKKIIDAQQEQKNLLLIAKERIVLEKKNLEKLSHDTQTHILIAETEKKACDEERTNLEKKIRQLAVPAATPTHETPFEKRKEYYQQFIARGNFLKAELSSLERKNQLVHQDDPSCPLCEQNLSSSRKKFLKATFSKQEQLITHQLARLTKVIKNLKELLIKQHEQLQDDKKKQEEHRILGIKIEELLKADQKLTMQLKVAHQQLQQLAQDVHKKTVELEQTDQKANKLEQETTHQLEQNPAYKAHKENLVRLVVLLEQCNYKQDEHQNLIKKAQEIEQLLQESQQFKQEVALQSERMRLVREMCAKLKLLKAEKIRIAQTLAAFGNLSVQEVAISKKEKELQFNIQELRQKKERLMEQKGQINQQLKTIEKIEQDSKEHFKNSQALDAVIDEYQAIAVATGKDGIQALLIEDALPEIEQETNNLLARLTNNQAHVIIESLRDLKKGGAKETLDIKISDPMGIRPYEMFSGGEAFRIDFALRIAISKLLARRAGTSLQTLIIDEGFGSQDDEGLSNIMESLYKIQDDFAKIIIVSHLPSMKDQFPVHFFVEKGPQGSLVKVIEND